MTFHELLLKFESEIASLFAAFRSHPAVQAVTQPAAAEPAAPAAEVPAAPVEAPQTGTDNWLTRSMAGQAGPQEAAPSAGPAAPTVDTSADTLDFNVVADIPINLTGPKTIVNCPAHVVVKAEQASGQSGAHNSYTITVNGAATFMPNVENEYISSNYGTDVQGPTVTVSVDSPGLQMEIQAA